MSPRRIRTDEVLVFLGVEREAFLDRLRQEGLFEGEELEPDEADELRLAQILMKEMGVNPAGVGVAIHLRRRLIVLEERARTLAEALAESRDRD
jgi:hypothetical protein